MVVHTLKQWMQVLSYVSVVPTKHMAKAIYRRTILGGFLFQRDKYPKWLGKSRHGGGHECCNNN